MMPDRGFRALLLATVFAVAAPSLLAGSQQSRPSNTGFPGWPNRYEARNLTQMPLTENEQAFQRGFPGRIARFSDGQRELIVRWVDAPTRRLHPASDCFRGMGYRIDPLPVAQNSDGIPMGCFEAVKTARTLRVCEYIEAGDGGETWKDVSTWYWHAVASRRHGGWWSFVVAEHTQALR